MATINILFLCTHNSARSILAEAMLNHWASKLGRDVRAYSAGSSPSGRINPFALRVLGDAGVDMSHARSKSWDEFVATDAPTIRIVITICDSAAAEQCPYWPGNPVKIHWGYPDPSTAADEEKVLAFELTRQALGYRVLQLLSLPLDSMTDTQMQVALTQTYQS
jgi:arsenate reductase